MARSRDPENSIRHHPTCSEWRIDAIYQVIHRSQVSIKEIAYRLTNDYNLPISIKSLQRFAMHGCRYPQEPNGHLCMHSQWEIPLQKAAENFAILDEMERQAGRGIPPARLPIIGDVTSHCNAVERHASELIIECTKAREQGLDPQALKNLRVAMSTMRRHMDLMDGSSGMVIYGRLA